MKKLLTTLALMTLTATAAVADPHIDRWKSYHSMGCMLLKECKDGVKEIASVDDLREVFPESDYDKIEEEFNDLLSEMKRIGVGVFVADEKYFPRGHRGVYHTKGNNFFLNKHYVWNPSVLLEVSRHEGWHAAQDCMAGDIKNNSIAIIHLPNMVPREYHIRADVAYASNRAVIPWEREALWAGEEPFMTANALRACQNPEVAMWSIYPPTPKTGEWLVRNGFWDGVQR